MSETNSKYHKLASAIYLMTSFFADQEPLKWRLRSLSADLVSDSLKDKGGISREIISFFGVAKAAGLVSPANHEILASELGKLAHEAEAPLLALLQQPEAKAEPAPATPELLPEVAKPAPPQPRPERELLPHVEPVKDNTLKEYGAVSVKKNSRQSIIIGLLKRKKEIMIKDVSPLISGCSEKTIQRELSEMVTAGVLKRIGEKRWTRYSLA